MATLTVVPQMNVVEGLEKKLFKANMIVGKVYKRLEADLAVLRKQLADPDFEQLAAKFATKIERAEARAVSAAAKRIEDAELEARVNFAKGDITRLYAKLTGLGSDLLEEPRTRLQTWLGGPRKGDEVEPYFEAAGSFATLIEGEISKIERAARQAEKAKREVEDAAHPVVCRLLVNVTNSLGFELSGPEVDKFYDRVDKLFTKDEAGKQMPADLTVLAALAAEVEAMAAPFGRCVKCGWAFPRVSSFDTCGKCHNGGAKTGTTQGAHDPIRVKATEADQANAKAELPTTPKKVKHGHKSEGRPWSSELRSGKGPKRK